VSEAPVLLREGRPEDLEAIKEFTTDTFSWGDYVPDRFLGWLGDDSGSVLVATDEEDHPIGLVHVQKMSAREGFLSGARVHPSYQRRGVGSLLNGAGVEWLKDNGAVVVRLTTEENNLAARNQVEKLGYRPVARFVMAERTFEHHGAEANGGRRLGLEDLVRSARRRSLWTAPSGWAIATQDDQDLWVSLLLTTPDEADRAVRALTDLAEEMTVEWMGVLVSRVPWLEQALAAEHLALNYPNVVYEKTIA
jgi:ribosomal protein S18 acetylase RimI-like enzyme